MVNVISVGHGDAIFIEFPNGKTMLVDGGTLSAGAIVVDYIKELGYSSVDYVVVAHDHDDHVGGLVTVLDSFEVGKLLMNNYNVETPLLHDVMSRVEEAEIPVTWVSRDDKFEIDDVRVVILNPPAGSTLIRENQILEKYFRDFIDGTVHQWTAVKNTQAVEAYDGSFDELYISPVSAHIITSFSETAQWVIIVIVELGLVLGWLVVLFRRRSS